MTDSTPTQRRGKLNRTQIANLRKLYNMRYTPAELAAAIGVTRRQFYRVYVPAGCPHARDEIGHLWINGVEFVAWYKRVYAKKPLQPGEAFCVSCKRVVQLYDPQSNEKGGMLYLQSICPNCGRPITRFVENHWKNSRYNARSVSTAHDSALQ